ncbi:MAG: gluconokinase [Symplocastrum torsivum CPER-KK1]|jgi:gluconokinase|uniref:Gluconokinase n=1 Tax=Symplocastrum torsivum CPER-KK1 TaxID=450513 RepID=A0A951PG35_9CYAN|nr:gluconokinase [Symplocastrum torsivum CPER-KK1]
MNTLRYIIGIDIGTTSTKAVLFTDKGKTVCSHALGYPLYAPITAAAEQDIEEIFSAVVTTIRQVVAKSGIDSASLMGLSFSAAMHSLIAVDAGGQPLTRSITWADNRSAKWAEKIKREQHGHEIYLRTGTPIHPMSPFVKLVWLRNEQPELFERTAKFISIKEYVFYQFFQTYVVDYSIASATGLLNLERLTWDQEALEIAGITEAQLSELVPTTHVLQPIQAELAQSLGIRADTQTVIGASDGVLSNLGVGAIAPGIVAVTVGTSGAVRAVVDRPVTDPQARLFCYAFTENQWVVGGAVNNGGIALRWVRDQLTETEVRAAQRLGKDPYDLITMLAETVPPGSEGLIFHPYLMGERSPIWDANARGSFFGLSLNHTKAHLVRAVLEGIVFNLSLVLQALEDFTGKAKRIQATGGFARSNLWRQMMADVFEQEVTVPEQYESSCLGAAVLGLYALQEISSLDIVSEMIGATYRHHPIAANAQTYRKILPIYTRVLQHLQGEYESIARLQAELTQEQSRQ